MCLQRKKITDDTAACVKLEWKVSSEQVVALVVYNQAKSLTNEERANKGVAKRQYKAASGKTWN